MIEQLEIVNHQEDGVIILDSRVCWHPHVETIDWFSKDLTSSHVIGTKVCLNGVHIQHGDRVLFAKLGKIVQSIGADWGGIRFWQDCSDICYKEGCAIHAHYGIRGGDCTYIFSDGLWLERKK